MIRLLAPAEKSRLRLLLLALVLLVWILILIALYLDTRAQHRAAPASAIAALRS